MDKPQQLGYIFKWHL